MKVEGILKGAVSLLATAIVVLSGFIYTQGSEFAALKQTVAIQSKDNDIQYRKIEKNTEKLNDVKGDIKENKVHLIHIKDSVDEIKDMIKEFYSRR